MPPFAASCGRPLELLPSVECSMWEQRLDRPWFTGLTAARPADMAVFDLTQASTGRGGTRRRRAWLLQPRPTQAAQGICRPATRDCLAGLPRVTFRPDGQ